MQSNQDFGKVLATALDVCLGLVHMHAEQVLHCDLKATNVLLIEAPSCAKGYVAKVADFGMAQNVDVGDTHVSGMFSGTLSHMAPESLVSGQVMFASDIYSLAIIFWELVTGDTIRLGCPPSLLAFMVRAGPPPLVTAVKSDTSTCDVRGVTCTIRMFECSVPDTVSGFSHLLISSQHLSNNVP